MKKEYRNYVKEHIGKKPVSEIAEDLGLSEESVRKFLKREREFKRKESVESASSLLFENKKTFYHSPRFNICAVLVLILLGAIIYSNTFDNAFHLDDHSSIIWNSAIRNISDIRAIWSFFPTRFITYLSIAFNYHLGQLDVFGYHVFNLLIHLVTTVMVWWLALLTCRTPALKNEKIGDHAPLIAFFTALIFVAHPAQTQTVNYIIQRTASFAALFYTASLALYTKSRLARCENRSSAVGVLCYYWSLLAAMAAMFSKETAITLPLMIMLYEFCFFRTEKGVQWKYAAPLLATIAIIPLTMFFTKSVNFGEMRLSWQRSPIVSQRDYLLTQFNVIITYIRILFLPFHQNFDYDYPISQTLVETHTLVSLFLLIVIFIFALRLFPKCRLVSFGIFWFLLSLLPESSIIPIEDVIFEHRLYLPMVGFSLSAASGLYYIFGRRGLAPMIVILCVIEMVLAILTYRRNFVWKDEFSLWYDTALKSPQKPRPNLNIGAVYQERGDLDTAIAYFDRAIQRYPGYAYAYNNRGAAYYRKKDFSRAISDLTKAIEIIPNYPDPYSNRGSVYQEMKELDKAAADFNKALELDPGHATTYYNRGLVYQKKGDYEHAIVDYNKALEIKPKYAEAYSNRGVIYLEKGELDRALSDFSRAIQLNPAVAAIYCNRGLVYQKKNDPDRAISDFTKALEINPKYFDAYYNRAAVYFYKKEYEKSWEDVRRAESLGYTFPTGFLNELERTSNIEK